MTLSRPLIGHLAMLAFSALVSFSFTFGALVADEIEPAVLTSLRFVIAIAVLVPLAALNGARLIHVLRSLWRWLLIGGLMAGYFITMFEALRLTTPLATSAVFTLTPLLATGFGWLLIGVRTGVVTLAALILGGLGALWVIFEADVKRALAMDLGPGERLFLLGVLAHAAVPALTRRLAPSASSLEAALGTTVGACLVAGTYALPTTLTTDFTALRPLVWYVAFYLGLVTTAVTLFLLQVAIARIAPGKVMAYTYLVPSLVVLQHLVHGRQDPLAMYVGVVATLVALTVLLLQDVVTPTPVTAPERPKSPRTQR